MIGSAGTDITTITAKPLPFKIDDPAAQVGDYIAEALPPLGYQPGYLDPRGRFIQIEDGFGNRYTYANLGKISHLYPVPRNSAAKSGHAAGAAGADEAAIAAQGGHDAGLVVSKHDADTWWDWIHRAWNDHLNVTDLCVISFSPDGPLLESTHPGVSADEVVAATGFALYELARKGIEVEREPRAVTIHGIDMLGLEGDTLTIADIKGDKRRATKVPPPKSSERQASVMHQLVAAFHSLVGLASRRTDVAGGVDFGCAQVVGGIGRQGDLA